MASDGLLPDAGALNVNVPAAELIPVTVCPPVMSGAETVDPTASPSKPDAAPGVTRHRCGAVGRPDEAVVAGTARGHRLASVA